MGPAIPVAKRVTADGRPTESTVDTSSTVVIALPGQLESGPAPRRDLLNVALAMLFIQQNLTDRHLVSAST
jgi:hypothetical protein